MAAHVASQPKSLRVLGALRRHTHTSSQLPVRITALILVSLLLLASSFGVDVLLGAFAAGIVVRLGRPASTWRWCPGSSTPSGTGCSFPSSSW